MNPVPPPPAVLRLVARLLPPLPGDLGRDPGLPEAPLDRLRREVRAVLPGRGRSRERPREDPPAPALHRVSLWMQAWGPALGRGCPVPRGALLGWIEEQLAPEEGTLALREPTGPAHPGPWKARCRALAARTVAMGPPEGRQVAAQLLAWAGCTDHPMP